MKALLFSVALIFALPAYAQTAAPVSGAAKIDSTGNPLPSTAKPPAPPSPADIGKAIISGAEGGRVGAGTTSLSSPPSKP